jgi:hypothetical protein
MSQLKLRRAPEIAIVPSHCEPTFAALPLGD